MLKTEIKLEVTPSQSKLVQEIVFANGGFWATGAIEIKYLEKLFLFIDSKKRLTFASEIDREYFNRSTYKEIPADLFIRTNGTCISILKKKLQIKGKP